MSKSNKNGGKETLESGVETLLGQATDDLGERLRSAGAALSEDEPDALLGAAANRAGLELESAGDRLRETEPSEILALVRGFARRQPLGFLTGSLLLGFLLGRLLRAGEEPFVVVEDEGRRP